MDDKRNHACYDILWVRHSTFILFLPAAVIISALISITTGSSWTIIATVGVSLLGIGEAMGFNSAIIAGTIISGAYFGDKISPLSDTTNAANTPNYLESDS